MRPQPIPPSQVAVLIVGAGPTGLTLACELARRRVPFRLIEAAPVPQPGSRGKGVQPRTLEVFDDLGIVGRILANGQIGMPIRMTSANGQVKEGGGVPLARRSDTPYLASLTTPEWRVEEALRLRLSEFKGAVEFGTALVSFEQSSSGVSAHIEREEHIETVDALWMVGCDGGHSLVRKQAGIRFEGDTYENVRMLVADLEADGLDRDAWHMWQHKDGFAALCPLPSTNLFQFQASVAPGQDPALSLANMQATLERRSSRTDIELQEPVWSSLWRANVRLADRYREGSVLIAGDAAHIHSPAGGQGMNTGIQDAQNLGWKLAGVLNGASASLLDTYEAERRPVALDVLALSNSRLKEAIEQKSIPTRRDASTLQLGIRYRDSVLSMDDRNDTAEVRAGDRAPDATGLTTVEGTKRLFDMTRGGSFTLLNFGPRITIRPENFAVTTLNIVEKASASGDVADDGGYLRPSYEAGDHTLVLIRPDGYIGMVSDAGLSLAVDEYLTALRLGAAHQV